MSGLTSWLQGRQHIQLLLQWRWLVLMIAIPISLVIEIIEGNTHGLQFLDEVIIDGLVLPITTWVVLTFTAKKIAHQVEREESLERRQRFMQELAEHREFGDLAEFIVRFPAALLPIDHASLFSYEHGRLDLVTEWNAPGVASRPRQTALSAPCLTCQANDAGSAERAGPCTCGREQQEEAAAREYRLALLHDGLQIGLLRLRCKAGATLTAEQTAFMGSVTPEIARALALAIEDSRQAERVYREAQAYERRRITQELHDSLAQQLFYLHLSLDQLAAEETPLTNDLIQRKLASMRDVAADVYEQIRNNLSILRAWEQVNITEAVSELARVTARNADLEIGIDVQGEPNWLSPHTCEHIYSVVREALNNVVKHARAQHVQLELRWADEHLSINLVDDGRGFEPVELPSEGHYGLALMRETITAMQGTLTLQSAPGSGTRLQVDIPLRLPGRYLRVYSPWHQELHTPVGAAI